MGDSLPSPSVALQEEVAVEEEDSKPLARLSVTLPIGLQVQAFARLESAQAELATAEEPKPKSLTRVKLLQAATAEEAAPLQATPRRRLSPLLPLARICGRNQNSLLSRLTRSRYSTRSSDSANSARSRDSAPKDTKFKQGGSTHSLGSFRSNTGSFRSNTREFAVGVAAGIVSHLKLSRPKIAMPYHVWVHKETDETPRLAPFAFGEMVAENLAKYGADVRLELPCATTC